MRQNFDPSALCARQKRAIYQARRGLKELDFYLDFYTKNHYLSASDAEKAVFDRLLAYEDPDLLLFFMEKAVCDDAEVTALIARIKRLKNAHV